MVSAQQSLSQPRPTRYRKRRSQHPYLPTSPEAHQAGPRPPFKAQYRTVNVQQPVIVHAIGRHDSMEPELSSWPVTEAPINNMTAAQPRPALCRPAIPQRRDSYGLATPRAPVDVLEREEKQKLKAADKAAHKQKPRRTLKERLQSINIFRSDFWEERARREREHEFLVAKAYQQLQDEAERKGQPDLGPYNLCGKWCVYA